MRQDIRQKPVIRWWGPQLRRVWARTLFVRYAQEVSLVADNESPDCCILGSFQTGNLSHYLGYKLLLSAENDLPDFEFYDWALSHAKRAPRNLRILPQMVGDAAIVSEVMHNETVPFVRDPVQCLRQKEKFCAFLFKNACCATRNHFFELLSRHRRVDAGGAALRTGPNAPPRGAAGHFLEAAKFYRPYKFVVAFENSLVPGYTTEKIWLALHAQSVPIYWGNPRVADYFHPDCFINAFDFDSMESLVQHVLRVDADDELYLHYLSAPRLAAKQRKELHEDEQRVKAFFYQVLPDVAAGAAPVAQQRIFSREILSRLAPAAIKRELKLKRSTSNKHARKISRCHIWPHRAFYDGLDMPSEAVPEA